MDDMSAEGKNESTSHSTDISDEKRPTVQQQDDEKLKQMNSLHPENNKAASFIQASRKGKNRFMSDEAPNSEPGGNSSSVLLGSNSRWSENEAHSEKNASFKGFSENLKCDFRSKTGLDSVHNITSSTTEMITEEITGESNVSSLVYAASDEESVVSIEAVKQHLYKEDTRNFLRSEEFNEKAGFGSKNIYYSKSFPKSEIPLNNKETDTISERDYKDEHISSHLASPVSCGNDETEVNAAKNLHTRDNATAEAAGPSGYRTRTHEKDEKTGLLAICAVKNLQKAHYLTHSEGKAFVCNLCPRKFTKKDALEEHYRTHTGEKPFVCEVCNKRFTRKKILKVHYRIHTGEKPFVCDVCNKRFTQKGDLDRHHRTHTGLKPFTCDVCQKGFTRQDLLKIHYRVHTGEKPYVCDICKTEFAQKVYLDSHYRTHTGEKLYVCDICNKRFTLQRSLKIHCRTHTGEKPYVCDVCYKGFAHLSSYKIHCKTHIEKMFVCEICKKDFADQSDLVKHARKHTGEKPYKCPICGKAYLDGSSFRRHYEGKHK